MRHSLQRSLHRTARVFVDLAKRGYHAFDPVRRSFVSLQPDGVVRGRALIAHKVEAFLRDPNDPLLRTHNHFTEARLLADAFLEQGYALDFIHYHNRWFVPKRHYDIFLGPRINFEALADRMSPGCIKIVHLDTAHWLYNNTAALLRLQEVQRTRGVALSSYTVVKENRAIERADFATLLGNEFDYETYAFAGKTIFQLPNPGTKSHPWYGEKDFSKCHTHFLWLGSRGLVHKGLDLVLEAFARMPDLNLTVCGPVAEDPHFVETFRKELYETPNIRTYGWIDITGPEFVDLANQTVAHIYPTAADACCGSVINCMHAGLIPVATREAGVDLSPSFGVTLSGQSAEAVQAAARHVAGLSAASLSGMAKASWHEAQTVYAPEHYKLVLGAVIKAIMSGRADAMTSGFVRKEAVVASGNPVDAGVPGLAYAEVDQDAKG
jgi:glycosyltransferase involved in cell wall biosynthesis